MTQLSSANSTVAENAYRFYALTLPGHAPGSTEPAAPGYRYVTWAPGLLRPVPWTLLRGQVPDSPLRLRHLIYFWIHHYLPCTGRREYRVLLVFRGSDLAHYSLVRSRDFRFPFMAAEDLQVGPVWTHADHRGKGLANQALAMIRARWADRHGRLWWVCLKNNRPSNQVAKKQGLSIAGEGWRRKKFGLRLFGRFSFEQEPSAIGCTPDFTIITETPGAGATRDQLSILYTRYHFASRWVEGKHVLEAACGAGVGLGFLARKAAQVTGGDIEDANWRLAAETYRNHPRIQVQRFDALDMPFPDQSFDVVIMFEAIYYLSDPALFLREVQRVLRPGGVVLISSVNSEWPGFQPSAHSRSYHNMRELGELLAQNDFEPALYAGFSDQSAGPISAMVQGVRRVAVNLHLIPRTMNGKKLLKRLFYGKLAPIPHEITEGMADLEPLIDRKDIRDVSSYKMIYAVGSKRVVSTP